MFYWPWSHQPSQAIGDIGFSPKINNTLTHLNSENICLMKLLWNIARVLRAVSLVRHTLRALTLTLCRVLLPSPEGRICHRLLEKEARPVPNSNKNQGLLGYRLILSVPWDSVTQSGLQPVILLPQLPECWDYRNMALRLTRLWMLKLVILVFAVQHPIPRYSPPKNSCPNVLEKTEEKSQVKQHHTNNHMPINCRIKKWCYSNVTKYCATLKINEIQIWAIRSKTLSTAVLSI